MTFNSVISTNWTFNFHPDKQTKQLRQFAVSSCCIAIWSPFSSFHKFCADKTHVPFHPHLHTGHDTHLTSHLLCYVRVCARAHVVCASCYSDVHVVIWAEAARQAISGLFSFLCSFVSLRPGSHSSVPVSVTAILVVGQNPLRPQHL